MSPIILKCVKSRCVFKPNRLYKAHLNKNGDYYIHTEKLPRTTVYLKQGSSFNIFYSTYGDTFRIVDTEVLLPGIKVIEKYEDTYRITTLEESQGVLTTSYETYLRDGRIKFNDSIPSIIVATDTNIKSINSLFNLDLRIEPESVTLFKKYLSKNNPCNCLVSDIYEPDETSYIRQIVSITDDYRFKDDSGTIWKYAIPIDIKIVDLNKL